MTEHDAEPTTPTSRPGPSRAVTVGATGVVLVAALAALTLLPDAGPAPTTVVAAPAAAAAAPPPPPAADPAGTTGSTETLPLAASTPVGIEVPGIGLERDSILELGYTATGALEVPSDAETVGWFSGGSAPGTAGPAVFASHVNYGGVDGGFARLKEMAPGDEIVVRREDGTTVRFEVDRVAQVDKDAFPTNSVYGATDGPEIRLITCGGDFDAGARSYVDNIIVYGSATGADRA